MEKWKHRCSVISVSMKCYTAPAIHLRISGFQTVLERHSAMSVKEIMRELQLTPLAATSGMRELMKEGRVARVKFADDSVQRYRLKG